MYLQNTVSWRNKKNMLWLQNTNFNLELHNMPIWHFFVAHLQIPGPVVQSIISLTSSLRVILLIVLADSIYNILIFFAEKM